MVVATQVDDFLFCGPHEELTAFENYICGRYKIGEISRGRFVFNGLTITSDPTDQSISLSQSDLKNIEPITVSRHRGKEVESAASDIERNHYRSLTGSLLWYGTQSVPHLLYLASSMARKNECLKIKNLKQGNANIKFEVTLTPIIRIRKTNPESTRISIFTDASHGAEGGVYSQEGVIVFKFDEDSKILSPLLWSSRKVKRIVKSTLAAETIAAVNGYDDGVYIQHL